MKEDDKELVKQGICPVCGTKLQHLEGCLGCIMCGWSACEEA